MSNARSFAERQLSTYDFDDMFPDEESCVKFLFNSRFGQDSPCPNCSRQGQWRFGYIHGCWYYCAGCGRFLKLRKGTIFHNSRLPLRVWFRCIWLMCLARNSLPGEFVRRYFGISPTAAWSMCNKIRQHMAWQLPRPIFSVEDGPIQIDETKLPRFRVRNRAVSQTTIAFGILSSDKVYTRLVDNRTSHTLLPIIEDKVEKGSTIYTDGFSAYRRLRARGYDHHTVNHKAGLWKTASGVTTCGIDTYWARLKRFIIRTYICVENCNIEVYLREFEYRYMFRTMTHEMFFQLISNHPPLPPLESPPQI